jgi:hypothetical protein
VRVQVSDLQRALPEMAGATPAHLRADPELRAAVDRYLVERLTLRAGDALCTPAGPVANAASADPAHVAYTWRLHCPDSAPPLLRIRPFFEAIPSHLHLARIETPQGQVIERVFVVDADTFAIAPVSARPADRGSGFFDYLGLGIEHIATGFDHLLFLLALLLVGVSLIEVATIVTGFTLAHSVTLALGVLGVVEPRSAAIEALIGLSIAIVAVENFALTGGPATRRWVVAMLVGGFALAAAAALAHALVVPATALVGVGVFSLCYLGLVENVARPARLRWFMAFVFGLIHGFGFAGLLTEIGLPSGHFAAALLGFNLGVELGQLAIVAAAWPVLRLALRGGPERRAFVAQLGSTPVLVAGLYWFLVRALG